MEISVDAYIASWLCNFFFNILVYQEELEPTTIYYWSQIILSDFPELLECPTLDTIGNYAS